MIVGVGSSAFAQTSKVTFTNAAANAIPTGPGTAATYPSNIAVAGVTGTPYHISVTLNLSHTFLADLDILLVAPGGRAVILLSDVGSGADSTNANYVFDECAPRTLTTTSLTTQGGRFRSVNAGLADPFAAPAPAGPYNDTLADLQFASPNGTWSLYVVDDLAGDGGSVNSWSITIFTQPTAGLTLVGGRNPISCTAPDYDGDGRSDVAIYRETTGEWFISQSGGGGSLLQASWGAPAATGFADMPIPADYDGDGITDLAVFRQSTGEWFARRSSDLSVFQVAFGAPQALGLGDRPVPSDYDGDGAADPAIFRTTTGEWFFRPSSGQPVTTFTWGNPAFGDRPAR
jgi:subtilisin-like proprotein convertase family protein